MGSEESSLHTSDLKVCGEQLERMVNGDVSSTCQRIVNGEMYEFKITPVGRVTDEGTDERSVEEIVQEVNENLDGEYPEDAGRLS